MSALPSDMHGPARAVVRMPRTIHAVRVALPQELRAQFNEEMETGEQPATFEHWWARAIIQSSPRTTALLEQARTGTLKSVPASTVFGDRWTDA